MTDFKWLGGVSLTLLIVALLISAVVLTGKAGRKTTYALSGIVLILMLVDSVVCMLIYRHFG